MLSFKRHNCLGLLLLLLLGHATLTYHVTTHISIDKTSCDYCAGNANPAHALAPASADLQPVTPLLIRTDPAPAVSVATVIISYRERAPPSPV